MKLLHYAQSRTSNGVDLSALKHVDARPRVTYHAVWPVSPISSEEYSILAVGAERGVVEPSWLPV